MNEKQLKTLLADEVISLGDLILAKNALTILDAGYQEASAETPEWVFDQLDKVSKEIVNRNRAELLRKLKTAQARRSSLATAEEKRSALDAEIATLQQKLS